MTSSFHASLAIWAVAFFTIIPPAFAESAELIGKFGSWGAYKYEEAGQPVCFMMAHAQKSEGKYSKRGDVYAMVTHRPGEGSRDVFSFATGYSYKNQAEIKVSIDGKSYILVGQGETAWAPNNDLDSRLTEALQKGSRMVIEGVSVRGTKTKDTFSLDGTGKAHDTINKACGF